MTVEESLIMPPPKIAIKRDNAYISEVCVYNNELIIVIDLDNVLSDEEIEEIITL